MADIWPGDLGRALLGNETRPPSNPSTFNSYHRKQFIKKSLESHINLPTQLMVLPTRTSRNKPSPSVIGSGVIILPSCKPSATFTPNLRHREISKPGCLFESRGWQRRACRSNKGRFRSLIHAIEVRAISAIATKPNLLESRVSSSSWFSIHRSHPPVSNVLYLSLEACRTASLVLFTVVGLRRLDHEASGGSNRRTKKANVTNLSSKRVSKKGLRNGRKQG